MMKPLGFALSILLLLGATAADAQARPRRLLDGKGKQKHNWVVPAQIPPALKLALNAFDRIRYSGTRVIQVKSGTNRQQHTELVLTNGPETRIEFPPESPLHGQIIVENPTERRQYFPARNEIQVGPPQRDQAIQRLATIVARRGVNVDETPGGPVAGMQTEVVSISDKKGNLLQKLWIENKSGMILKRELYDRLGTLQASFEFTQANLNPIIHPTDFKLERKGVRTITPDDILTRIIRKEGFQDVRFPAGTPYKLELARMQKLASQRVLVQQYAGNGHRISLYQLNTTVDPSRLGKIAPAGVQVYTWSAGGASFVLVGDLPEAELKDLGHRLGG
ncbi:MAG TPA: hypothetical protein VHE55_14970 [Fimbriimonadaceae bacterium]|nr:hypothetical protein [Fimbriimonadaceae bacterium]